MYGTHKKRSHMWRDRTGVEQDGLTSEEGTNFPDSDGPLTVVLAQHQLHEEERQGAEHRDQEVGKKEGTCRRPTGNHVSDLHKVK